MLGKILSTFKLWLTFVWAKQLLYTCLLTYYSDTYHMCTWCFQSLIITFSSNTSSQSWSNIWSRRSTFLDQAIGPQVPFRKKYETIIMTASKHTSPNFFQMLQLQSRNLFWYKVRGQGVNTWCNANSVSFKCHSISVNFKFCAVLVALCAPEPCSMDSLGTQHCANFESHSNRVTFETNAISITSSIHALRQVIF